MLREKHDENRNLNDPLIKSLSGSSVHGPGELLIKNTGESQ